MYRIDNPDAVALLPPPTALNRPAGYFSPGDEGAGVLATIVDAEWLNMVQEEISWASTRGGAVALNKASRTQLWDAIVAEVATGGTGLFVRIAGDTMTGNLAIHPAAISWPTLYLMADAGQAAQLTGTAIGQTAWTVLLGDSSARTGGNVGSNFLVNRFNDAGGFLETPFQINRSTGIAAFSNRLLAAGGVSFEPTSNFAMFDNPAGGNRAISWNGGGWNDTWRTVDGMRAWTGPAGDLMTLNGNGLLTTLSDVQCHSAIAFTASNQGNVYATLTNSGTGAFRFLGSPPNFQQLGVGSYGGILSYNTMNYPTGGGAWSCDVAGNTQQPGNCFAAAYPGPSDATLKENITPWTPGLDVILGINTVAYEYTPGSRIGEPGTRYYGVTAQDVLTVLPEAVRTMKHYRHHPPSRDHAHARAEGAPEEHEEVLAVEANTIFYAALNAIKELASRLDSLEKARAG